MPAAALRSMAAVLLATATAAAAAASARADDRVALHLVYQAGSGCPVASAFAAELIARTGRVRMAGPEEGGREVRVEVRAETDQATGRLVIEEGGTREVSGATCAEVVSALALITALAFDPKAETGPVASAPAASGPTTAEAPTAAPTTAPPAAPPASATSRPRVGPPDTSAPAPAPPAEPVLFGLGLDLVIVGGAAPRVLVGGGPFLELRGTGAPGWVIRGAFDYATTGPFDEGPGGAVFTSATGQVLGCVPVFELAAPLSVAPCVDFTAGSLTGEGLERGEIVDAREATIGWAAAGVTGLARLELSQLLLVELRAGASFPWIRHTFVFEVPPPQQVLVHEVPAVVWALGAGVGLLIP